MTRPLSGIYKIVNLKNNKVYVGQSKNIFLRRVQHFHALNKGTHPNKELQKDWTAQRGHYFRWEEIELCSLDKLNEREKYWIDQYDSIKKGYNQGWTPYNSRK